MNPLQEKLFEIQIKELLLMSYNICTALLQSLSLYLQRAEAHDMPARGSENAFPAHHTARRPPDANLLQWCPLHSSCSISHHTKYGTPQA
jgi:hypothetical protein